ncbi:MAG: hypothetical protein M5R42_01555 [Rhodocyclaceae bacterium]|nr:hypothetical protein [Rhodocyclaceae bacterium]
MQHGDAELFKSKLRIMGRQRRRAADDEALDGGQLQLVALQVLQQAESQIVGTPARRSLSRPRRVHAGWRRRGCAGHHQLGAGQRGA